MKRLAYCLSAVLAACTLLSCRQDDPEPEKTSGIEILNGEITFQPDGGKDVIHVKASGAISAQADKPWCSVSVEGSDQVRVEVPAYKGIETRYAYVEIRCGEETVGVTIHQFGVIVRSFNASDIFMKNTAAEYSFSYDANASMTATTEAGWIHLKVDGNTLNVSVDRNEGKQARTGTIHWEIGAMTDSFDITQFDPAESGLLGNWTWNSARVSDNSAFQLAASLDESGDGAYELTLVSDKMNFTFTDVRLDGTVLQIPLGKEIGTYTANGTNTYRAFCIMAPGNSPTTYNNVNAVTSGFYTFDLNYDELADKWTATGRASDYPNKNFRFEYWTTSAHEGNSRSRTALKNIVLEK